MFKYHVENDCKTVIQFNPQSSYRCNGKDLLTGYKDDIDARQRGFITDVEDFLVYEYGMKF